MQYALTDNDRIVKCYSTSGETYYIRHLDLGIPIKIFTCNCPSFQFRDVLSCKHPQLFTTIKTPALTPAGVFLRPVHDTSSSVS